MNKQEDRLRSLGINGPTKYHVDAIMSQLFMAGLVEAKDEDSAFPWWRLTADGIVYTHALGIAVSDQEWPTAKIVPPITPNGLPSPAKGG